MLVADLPADSSEHESVSETPDQSTFKGTGTERILLVDDEAAVAQLEKPMLERLAYRVTAYTSSVDTLAAFTAAQRIPATIRKH